MSTTQPDLRLTLNNWVYFEAPDIRATLTFLESTEGRPLTDLEIREVLRGCERQCAPQLPSLSSLLLQLKGELSHAQ